MKKKSMIKKIAGLVLGVFLCVTLLEIGLYLSGIFFVSSQDRLNAATLQKGNAYRILCLGDSTTAIGGEDSWPNQLEEVLNNKKLGKEFSVINKGVVLADSMNILSQLEANLEEYGPQMVIIMVGINDIKKKREEAQPFHKVKSLLRNSRTYRLIELLQPDLLNKQEEYLPSEEIYQSPTVKSSFNKIKEMLDKKAVQLVMMQYPVRSVEPLKMTFESEEGIIFIDNEDLFKNALKENGYKYYFMDNFGGDFGHCTKEGNRIIAENIANTLIEEKIFSKIY